MTRFTNRARIAALIVGFFIGSFALCLGIGVYLLTLGPKAIGDYIRDRFMAWGLIILAAALDLGTASILTHRWGGFMLRFLLSVLVTVAGAILLFALIAARAIVLSGRS